MEKKLSHPTLDPGFFYVACNLLEHRVIDRRPATGRATPTAPPRAFGEEFDDSDGSE